MILPVYLYGSTYLRKENADVTPDLPGLEQLIADMYETMYNAEGVGIAAPQVGHSLRLFVVDSDPLADEDPRAKGFRQTFINPEILERTGDMFTYREGCLSIPNFKEDITRRSIIKIRYLDENFVEHTDVYDGMVSRIVQHEYDHIEKILFTDLLSQLKKKMVSRKLNNIAKGKAMPPYRARID